MNSTFDHFGAAGGFMETNNFQSPSNDSQNQGGKKVYKAQNCVPVSIRQILESTEDNFKIGQQTDVHLVTIVGLLIKKDSDSTKSSYVFDDYTGTICAHIFTYNDAGVAAAETDYEVGQYYRVFGSVRMSDGKHHIMTFKLEPLESLDELTMHLLEVVYVPLSLDEHDVEESAGSTMNVMNGDGGSDFRTSMMHAGANNSNDNYGNTSNRNSGLTARQNMVFQLIKSVNTESGLDTSTIPPSQISRKDLEPILEFLTGEGHIYTTIDEHHYKSTDI